MKTEVSYTICHMNDHLDFHAFSKVLVLLQNFYGSHTFAALLHKFLLVSYSEIFDN